LESVCRGNSTVGSNPTLSASSLAEPSNSLQCRRFEPQTAKFHSPTEQSPEDSPRDPGLPERFRRSADSAGRTFARTLAISPKHFLVIGDSCRVPSAAVLRAPGLTDVAHRAGLLRSGALHRRLPGCRRDDASGSLRKDGVLRHRLMWSTSSMTRRNQIDRARRPADRRENPAADWTCLRTNHPDYRSGMR